MAFCPSVSELSFLSFVVLSFPSGGCSLVGKVVVFDLEASFVFAVFSYGEVDLSGPRGTSFVSLIVGALVCVRTMLWTFEANLFCSALLLVKPMF